MRDEQTSIGTMLSVLFWPLRLLFAWAVFLVHSWAVSRRGWAFVNGSMAIIVAVGFLGALWSADYLREGRRVKSSQVYFNFYLRKTEFGPTVSEMFAEKLVEMEPHKDKHKFQLAEIQDYNGKPFRAFDLMTYLAPLDGKRPSQLSNTTDSSSTDDPSDPERTSDQTAPEKSLGFPAAHVWLAQFYMKPQPDLTDEQRDELVIKHLDTAIEADPENEFALGSLADFHRFKAQDFEKGTAEYEAELRRTVIFLNRMSDGSMQAQMQALPSLIAVLVELNDKPEAQRQLNRSIKKLLPLARRYPDEPFLWRTIISACILLKDYRATDQMVAEGLQLAKKPEVRKMITELAASAVVDESDSLDDLKDRDQFMARLNLLCDGVAKYPTSRFVYLRLLLFIAPKTNPDFNLDWLNESIIDSPHPAVVHILLGVYKISQGDVVDGQKHWRIAEQQFAPAQFVINNAIDVAIHDYPDDFGNMLDVVTLAIELFPNQPLLYQTRGVYYMKNGRYPEAIADLKHAQEKLPQLLSLCKYLIDCYRETGETGLVDEQQSIITATISELPVEEQQEVEKALKSLR